MSCLLQVAARARTELAVQSNSDEMIQDDIPLRPQRLSLPLPDWRHFGASVGLSSARRLQFNANAMTVQIPIMEGLPTQNPV